MVHWFISGLARETAGSTAGPQPARRIPGNATGVATGPLVLIFAAQIDPIASLLDGDSVAIGPQARFDKGTPHSRERRGRD
jgi:hypothetical protein